MIPIGNMIYAGLGHYNGGGVNVLFNDWWEYDPATNAWAQKADYMGGICYHAAAFTIGNYGYVGTGRISPSGSTLVQSFYRFDPQTNTWNQIADFPGTGRRGACAFTANGYGYVGSGETTTGRTADFYRYNPATNSWIVIATFPGAARTSAVAFEIDGYGYVGTGDTDLGSINDLWRYSAATNTWQSRANVGPTNRQEAMSFALNGVGYIGTGVDFEGGNNFKDMWEYTPATDTWIQISDFEGSARRYLSGVALNGDGYAGLGTNGTNFNDFWVFDQTASLLERNIENIQIIAYPNPASSIVSVKIEGVEQHVIDQLEIDIYNLLGQRVKETSTSDSPFISLDNVSSGVHFVALKYKGEIIKQTKLIVQN
jgi:N-acetylneuraminic acid mutarotase